MLGFVNRYTLNVNRSGIPTINESRFTNTVLRPALGLAIRLRRMAFRFRLLGLPTW